MGCHCWTLQTWTKFIATFQVLPSSMFIFYGGYRLIEAYQYTLPVWTGLRFLAWGWISLFLAALLFVGVVERSATKCLIWLCVHLLQLFLFFDFSMKDFLPPNRSDNKVLRFINVGLIIAYDFLTLIFVILVGLFVNQIQSTE